MDENSTTDVQQDQASQAIRSVCVFLDAEKVPFCLIGGFALGFYDLVRFTKDIDLKISISPKKWPSLHKRLESNPQVSELKVHYISSQKIPDILRCHWCSHPVDFLVANTPYQREVIQRAKFYSFQDVHFKVASPEDLIVLKLIASRPQDLLDIALLLKKLPKMNARYIRKWVRVWEMEDQWNSILRSPLV